MKKVLALVLTLCLLLMATPAFALELLSAGDTYPIDTDKTITWYVQGSLSPHEKYSDWTESPFHTGMIEQTGVNIEWSFPTTGTDGGTFTNTLLADPSSLPNILGISRMSDASLFIEDEVIWDLTDYIQEYAPAYYAFLQTNPAYDKALKTDDGQYYAFGFFREDGGWNDSYRGPVIRTDWLEECGLEIPKTISEFENVIRVFNEKYGAQFSFAWSRFQQGSLEGAFGAYATSDATYYVKDGKVGLGNAQPEWRDYVSWLNKLYEDGLFDQDNFSLDDTSIKAKVHDEKVGVSMTSMGQLNNWNKERVADGKEPVWIGIPYPTDEDGNISSIFGGSGIGSYTYMISKSTDEETMKLCLQVLDYAYTQEGFLYWNFGKQGVSWDYDENGEPAFLPLVTDDQDTDPMTKYNGATWGAACIQATKLLYLKNSQVAVEANDTWFYSVPQSVSGGWQWPNGTTYTVEESDELSIINTSNVGTYASESFANFVTGVQDIDDDATWEAYLANYDSYKLPRILEIRQACYDRYLAR
ncbi:MAG: extracellular solute-binding protein [Clostridia bacterium]|nr:extracellular solute-binding protein [Clostridia bacterium]